jgi:hypothetical protein
MSLDVEELLLQLLVRVHACRRGAQKVEYSREDGRTLWDGGDRVEYKKYSFYVTLHHFSGEAGDGIGQHVAVAPADVAKFCGGEKHVYRLRRGSGAREHLSVYVYNPAVNANGPLRFEVRTTDAVQRTESRCVEVAEDTCPTVLRFGCASMQTGHETVLRRLEHEYQIVLEIGFFGESQRAARTPRCTQCCDLRLDLFGEARRGGVARATRRWYCTHCFELRHWV